MTHRTDSDSAAPVAAAIDGRIRDLDGLEVRRVLPTSSRRMVGPFTFLDQMGPAVFEPGVGLDVRPHPHIGLATATYLFEGAILHRDSLGSSQVIVPGDVNWMIAGSGIVHSERTPPGPRAQGGPVHGLQFWIALPLDQEEGPPSFRHHPAATLPSGTESGVRLRLLAGAAFGETAPVATASPLFYVDAAMDQGARLALPGEYEERALYVADGEVSCGSMRAESGRMLVFAKGRTVDVRAERPSRVVIFGGDPLDGARFIDWNFVSSSKERIAQARDDWRAGRFPTVPGDEVEFVPLPG